MTAGKVTLREVRVFDGRGLTEPRTVVIDGPVIGTDGAGARTIDAAGAAIRPGASFAAATGTVTALHEAGVTILAGTDAVMTPGMPVQLPHGESLHQELELLVAAGLSPVAALRAATSGPAGVFGLGDRGAVRPGLRADLVLLDGDPLTDIRATRRIRRIWCGGVECTPSPAGALP